MKKNKICFIVCGNNDFLCQEVLHYILNLHIPYKFEIDYMIINDVHNIFEAYNAGMQESDATYKVYINENVFITDKCFLINIIDIFTNNTDIGMIGAIGYIDNKDTIEEMKKVGRVVVGGAQTKVCDFSNSNKIGLEEVFAIEPNIVITACDEEWVEDKDLTKAMVEKCNRLRNLGYRSAILLQEKPWCIYDNDLFRINA